MLLSCVIINMISNKISYKPHPHRSESFKVLIDSNKTKSILNISNNTKLTLPKINFKSINLENRDFFLTIHQCYDHCEKEKEKNNQDNFDYSLFFQCSSSKICKLEYDAFLNCYRINKNKCSTELLGLGNCLDNRIDQFYLQLINTK